MFTTPVGSKGPGLQCRARVANSGRSATVTRAKQGKRTARGSIPELSKRELGVRVGRGLLSASVSVGFGALIEVLVRPKGGTAEEVARLVGDGDRLVVGQDTFARAQAELKAQEYEEAIEDFTKTIDIVPEQYTLSMRSMLGRRDANAALGRRDQMVSDTRQEFGWGRGIRWPGWYIIGAILLRNEIVRDT